MVLVLLIAPNAGAESSGSLSFAGPRGKDGLPEPWILHVWKGNDDFELVCDHEGRARPVSDREFCAAGDLAIRLRCDRCSYLVTTEHALVVDQDLTLEWDWKALYLPSRGDVRERRTDDQALQIFVYFADGTVLNYVWDSNAPKGLVVPRRYGIPRILRIILFFLDLPPDLDVRHVVLQSGGEQVGDWLSESRNVGDDYSAFFDARPPLLQGIGIQINSQHTRDSAEGLVRGLRLSR